MIYKMEDNHYDEICKLDYAMLLEQYKSVRLSDFKYVENLKQKKIMNAIYDKNYDTFQFFDGPNAGQMFYDVYSKIKLNDAPNVYETILIQSKNQKKDEITPEKLFIKYLEDKGFRISLT